MPTAASRAVIFPKRWFCSAEWSWLSAAIPDNTTGDAQTCKAISDSQRKSHEQLISCESQASVSALGQRHASQLSAWICFLFLQGHGAPHSSLATCPVGPCPLSQEQELARALLCPIRTGAQQVSAVFTPAHVPPLLRSTFSTCQIPTGPSRSNSDITYVMKLSGFPRRAHWSRTSVKS